MQSDKTRSFSSILILCLIVFAINFTVSISNKFFSSSQNERNSSLNGSDAKGYYEYLEWAISGKNINYESGNSFERGKGRILKYTYGTALFQLPFYCASKLFQPNTKQNFEYTKTDEFFICLGASLYIALALCLLYKLLGKFTSNTLAKSSAVLLIYFATNLFHYSSMELMMSHLYSFLSVTGYILYTLHFIETKRSKHLWLSLLFLFLIIAIRPFNIIIVIPIICYLFYKQQSITQLFLSGITIVLSFCGQLLLWRIQCGIWTLASYDGEGFYWNNPQIYNVLLSFRKGLFIYSPIILISLIGFFYKWKFDFKYKITLVLTCLIFTYSVSCWWHWPYGDSFGHRAFIDIYPIATIGLVSLIAHLKKLFVKIVTTLCLGLFVSLNLFQTWQYNQHILPAEYLNYDKYKFLFFNSDKTVQNYLGGPKDIFPYKQSYELVIDSLLYMNMDSLEYSNTLDFINDKGTFKKCYIDVTFTKEEVNSNQSLQAQLCFQIFDKEGNGIFFYGTSINETPNDFSKPNSKTFSYQITIPSLKNKETLRVVFRNPERKKFILKDILVKRYLFIK